MYSSYACLRHVESKQGHWPCWFMPCEQRLLGKTYARKENAQAFS